MVSQLPGVNGCLCVHKALLLPCNVTILELGMIMGTMISKPGLYPRPVQGMSVNGATANCAQVNMPYHIRVLVPCYKESYDIVTRTLEVRAASRSLQALVCIPWNAAALCPVSTSRRKVHDAREPRCSGEI